MIKFVQEKHEFGFVVASNALDKKYKKSKWLIGLKKGIKMI